MHDTPYTLPEEDPFSAQPPRLCMQPQRPVPRRRRSSLLDKWIHDQQTQQQGSSLQDLQHKEDAITLSGYDFVEDDDIPRNSPLDPEHPLAPIPSTLWRSSKLLHTPSPFRNLAISFRSSSTSISNQSESSSSRLSRFSFIPRHNRHSGDSAGAGIAGKSSTNFPRTSTISTISNDEPPSSHTDFSPISTTSSRWRPSVLEHFSSSSSTYLEPPDVISSKSRPSLSSNDTQTATTSDNSDFPITPTTTTKNKLFDHARACSSSGSVFRPGPGFASSSSIWSSSQKYPAVPSALASTPTLSIPYARRPSNVPHAHSQPILASRTPLAPKPTSSNYGTYTGLGSGGSVSDEEDGEDEDEDANDDTIVRAPILTRPHVAYSASKASLPRVKFSSLTHARQNKKKRKLVISGIAHGDSKKFEGIKKWCESFGEVNQIVRMPNGDLHVHFRLAEVAETVCRVKAKVTIAGVGSVQLSWYTGDKR